MALGTIIALQPSSIAVGGNDLAASCARSVLANWESFRDRSSLDRLESEESTKCVKSNERVAGNAGEWVEKFESYLYYAS